MSAKPPRGQSGNLFFTARVGEVDTALFDAIDQRSDQMRQAERFRHVGVQFSGDLPEEVEVPVGEHERLELVPSGRSLLSRWHGVHSDSSDLGVTGPDLSLP